VSDGELLSELQRSNVVTVGEEDPSVLDSVKIVGLKSDGSFTNTLSSDVTAVVQFELLSDSDVNNSTITWFVNGQQFKTGTFGATNADRLLAGEKNSAGDVAMVFNDQISVTVIPQTDGATGDSIQSETLTVQNALPVATNVKVAPAKPRTGQNLVLSFIFTDADIVLGNSAQSNASTVKWFKKSRTTNNQFVEVKEYANESVIPSIATKTGDQWKAVVTPNDSVADGTTVESNTVTVA
jgi:hypothetical protein